MANYDFLNLSPFDFEELSRDLLQVLLKKNFESFAEGKDDGIDLRFSMDKENEIIVQCKRYNNISSLLSNLKIEKTKITKLNPKRYILCTSVNLTKTQKDKILKILSPYILSYSDIIGKKDLNNFINKFPDIEEQHFKLWLSSINVLKRILKGKVYNQSNFEKETIEKTVKVYVENSSFFKALEIIKKYKYVIISGIPGIGKTTLARILVYNYLANGYKEFIYLSDSIDDAYIEFDDNKKQIFFFDDFLGRSFLGKKLTTNEEQRIFRFIKKIQNSKNSILILATREYILKQAKECYDAFNNPEFSTAKCIIDLSNYTKLIRAKILYNHLFFSNTSFEHILNILQDKNYMKIINHKNYNPRILEIMIYNIHHRSISPNDFTKEICKSLENPFEVWSIAYKNDILLLSRILLAILLTTGIPILLNDLKKALKFFFEKYGQKYNLYYNDFDFNKSVREIENTFITILKDDYDNFVVDVQNPSVYDYLINELNNYHDLLSDILSSALFINQFFNSFTLNKSILIKGKVVVQVNKILLDNSLIDIISDKIIQEYDKLDSSNIIKYTIMPERKYRWDKFNSDDYSKLSAVNSFFALHRNDKITDFISKKFYEIIEPNNIDVLNFGNYLNLLREYHIYYQIDINNLLKRIFKKCDNIQLLNNFNELKNIFPNEFELFLKNDNEIIDDIIGTVENEVEYTSNKDLEDMIYEIDKIEENYGIDMNFIHDEIKERQEEIVEENDILSDHYIPTNRTLEYVDDNEIDNIFNTLMYKK